MSTEKAKRSSGRLQCDQCHEASKRVESDDESDSGFIHVFKQLS
jgi:hypothetical protein